MQLAGIHHLTAVTARARQNLAFYTQGLGMRLVKKTVNQDDTSAYHLFYADARGSPGTDLTFFDWPMATRERRGTRSIVRTALRVGSDSSIAYWEARLAELGATASAPEQRDGRLTLDFEDFEAQRLALVVDASVGGEVWEKSPVPPAHQIRGLGPITISVPELAPTEQVLTGLMQMRAKAQYELSRGTDGAVSRGAQVQVFEMGEGGPGAELHVAVEPELAPARYGAGGVHHVAFRIPTFEEYDRWAARLGEFEMRNSGPVDRFYFRSLYFREPSGILFELATDGPGFTADEPLEHLGQRLSLPPFLEERRKLIESRLKPL